MMKVIEIQNFEAPELDVYARLTENQLVNRADPTKGMFIAESPKVIMRVCAGFCADGEKTAGDGGRSVRSHSDVQLYK